jgi:hypothetical protein
MIEDSMLGFNVIDADRFATPASAGYDGTEGGRSLLDRYCDAAKSRSGLLFSESAVSSPGERCGKARGIGSSGRARQQCSGGQASIIDASATEDQFGRGSPRTFFRSAMS